MTGVLGLVAGILQLSVPSYAFRLVRRYGTKRAGWFIVAAFIALALLHIFVQAPPGSGSEGMVSISIALGALLLLIGMGHVEKSFEAQDRQQDWAGSSTSSPQHDPGDLERANQELRKQIAARDEALRTLQDAEARYRFLFTECPQPMWMIDLRTARFAGVNRAALNLFGYATEEFMSRTACELMADPSDPRFQQELATTSGGAVQRGVCRYTRKDGSVMDLEISTIDFQFGHTTARLVVAHDATERFQREVQERYAEKMELISRFSAGTGRHFNAILNSIERSVAQVFPQLRAESSGPVNQISSEIAGGVSFTRQLLAAGGQHPSKPDLLDLNALIRTLNHKMTRLLGENILLQNSYGCYNAPVMGDSRLIEQAVVSLIVNARDAMPDGGTVIINTSIHKMPGAADVIDGPEIVRLSIRDTGVGMSSEIQAKIFDPFFTTKDPAAFIGLGLSTVHGIMRQHRGWVEVSSAPGEGSEFVLCFPIAVASEDGTAPTDPQCRGTILIVEADARTRSLARCSLTWNGFRVIEADSSSLAIVLSERQSSRIDLLLTNLTFASGPTGIELAAQLQQVRPDLRVVYTADSVADREVLQFEQVRSVLKPYTPDKLLEEVQAAFEYGT